MLPAAVLPFLLPRNRSGGSVSVAAMRRRAVCATTAAAALLVCASAPASAQSGERLDQDRVEVRGRSSLDVGAGARAYGMAGAFLARADDATAASWNPAGLSYLRNPEVSIVGARNAFDRGPEGGVPNDRFVGLTPDFAAFAYPLEWGPVRGAAQLSFQRVFSFRGSRTVEKQSFVLTTKGKGGFDVLAIGTGLQVARSLRAGVTLNRWFNGYHQSRARTGSRRQRQELDYDLSGWNVNLGLMWTPHESLNLGLVGKTPFTGKLKLRRERTDFFPTTATPEVITTNAAERDDLRL